MLARLFKPRAAAERGRALYAALIAQARTPAFYAEFGVPDTVEGRFELYSLHLALILRRLKRQGGEAEETAQALFDSFVGALDDALRDMGVGDLSVGKKMRRLGEALYGRLKSYDEALAGEGDLAALIGRTVYAEREEAGVAQLADYARRAEAALAAAPVTSVIAGEPPWPTLS